MNHFITSDQLHKIVSNKKKKKIYDKELWYITHLETNEIHR